MDGYILHETHRSVFRSGHKVSMLHGLSSQEQNNSLNLVHMLPLAVISFNTA